jgi:hypothetical protein
MPLNKRASAALKQKPAFAEKTSAATFAGQLARQPKRPKAAKVGGAEGI